MQSDPGGNDGIGMENITQPRTNLTHSPTKIPAVVWLPVSSLSINVTTREAEAEQNDGVRNNYLHFYLIHPDKRSLSSEMVPCFELLPLSRAVEENTGNPSNENIITSYYITESSAWGQKYETLVPGHYCRSERLSKEESKYIFQGLSSAKLKFWQFFEAFPVVLSFCRKQ